MTMTITADLEMSTMQCAVMEIADPLSLILSSALELTKILEVPQNLTMIIQTRNSSNDTDTVEPTPEQISSFEVVEGLEFLVRCQSSASTSSFEYAIYKGDSLVSNQSAYTPGVIDRCGLRVTCQDNVAVKWTGGSTFISNYIYPEFTPPSGDIAVRVEPSVVIEGQEFTFFCSSTVDAISKCSNFTYEIQRQKDGALLSTSNTYTPGRDVVILQCNLSTDANWVSGVMLTTSYLVEPIASTRAIGLEWQTKQMPQLFLGEPLNITCTPVDITRCAAIALKVKPATGEDVLIGCRAKGNNNIWEHFNNGSTHQVDGLSAYQCNRTVPLNCGHFNLTVTNSADLEGSTLQCSVTEMADPTSIIISPALELTNILEIPENLTMTIKTGSVVEDSVIEKPERYKVSIRTNMMGVPQFYRGQNLNVTCQPHNVTNCLSIMLHVRKPTGETYNIGCTTYVGLGDNWLRKTDEGSMFTNPTQSFCGVNKCLALSFKLSIPVTNLLEGYSFYCKATDEMFPGIIESNRVNITKVYDLPPPPIALNRTQITKLSVNGHQPPITSNGTLPVTEGLEFLVKCQSTASTSAYDYAIYRADTVVANQSTYRPIVKDRCGLKVTCQDNVAVKWTGGNTFVSKYIYPEFKPRSGEIAVRVEPPVTIEGQEFTFFCSSTVDAITECSNFTYEILRQEDGALLSSNNTYTPGRNALILRCNLSTDANLASGVKLMTSYLVEPIARSRATEMEWQTSQMLQFYLGESINISCNPVDITRCAAIALKIRPTIPPEAVTGCMARGNDSWVYINRGFKHQVDGFNEVSCNRTFPRDCGQFNLSLTITADLEKSTLQCIVAEMADPTSIISSSALVLTEILEVPNNLTMRIKTVTNDTLPVREGSEFVAKCQSNASTSSYDYAIYRGESIVSNQTTYVPKFSDRCGLRVTCQDNVAVKWTRGNTFASKTIYPEFTPSSRKIGLRKIPWVIVEGQQFTVTCTTTIATIRDCSNFTYEIRRQVDGALISRNNTYTPTRDFLMVQCNLSTDANILSGAELSKTIPIEPLATTRAVEIEWHTNQKQQLYVGEILNITCKPVDITRCGTFALNMKPANGESAAIGCEAKYNGNWAYLNVDFTHRADGFSEQQCNRTIPLNCGQYSISLPITADMEKFTLQCSVSEMADSFSSITSSTVELAQILGVPENLTMTIQTGGLSEETDDSSKRAIEGSEFLVKCQSSTTNASGYEYAIYRGDSMVSNQSTYTPNVSDRCGLRVTCRDNVAVNWTGGNIFATNYIYPEFTQRSGYIAVKIEPLVVVEGREFSVLCSANVDTITECSNFAYEIRRQLDGALLTTNNTYTPGRDAFKIRCNLTTAANWVSGEKTTSLLVEPLSGSRKLGMHWQTDQFPQFYVGESLSITCQAFDITRCAAIALMLNTTNGQEAFIGCKAKGNGTWGYLNDGFTNEVDGFSEEQCNRTIPHDCGQFNLIVTITADLEMSKIQCAVTEMEDPSTIIASSAIRLTKILDVPENLTMTIQAVRPSNYTMTAEPTSEQMISSEAIEGSKFLVKCQSSATTSSYDYAVYRKHTLVSNQSTYTPKLLDRCGLKVTCQDNVAVKWTGGNTFASTLIYPEFTPPSAEIAVWVEPSVVVEGQEFTFFCSSTVDAITGCSNFTYEIRRQLDGDLLSTNNTYTPGRDAVILRCNLSTDASFIGGAKLTTLHLVEPLASTRGIEMEWQTKQMPQLYVGENLSIKCQPVDITRCAAIALKVKPATGQGVLIGCRVNENGTWEYFNNGSTDQVDGFSKEQCSKTIPRDCGQFKLNVEIAADLERSMLQCSVAEMADPTTIISSSALELTKILEVPKNLTMTIRRGRPLDDSAIKKPDDYRVSIHTNTEGVPYFYKDQNLSVTCQPHNVKNCVSIMLHVKHSSGSTNRMGCRASVDERGNWYARRGMSPSIFGSPSHTFCQVNKCSALRFNVTDLVASYYEGLSFYCEVTDEIYNGIIESSRINIIEVHDVPPPPIAPNRTQITKLSVDGQKPPIATNGTLPVTEGAEFTVNCQSSASSSAYDYVIYRDDSMVSNQSTYSPIVKDRCGLRVTCQDNVAIKWTGGNTFTSKCIYPEFRSSSGEIAIRVKPSVVIEGQEFTFFCSSTVETITECSNLTYEIRRQNDGALLSTNNTYTPGREALILQCNLSTNANWVSGVKLMTSYLAEPIATTRAVEMGWQTNQKPQLYSREVINITCTPVDITRCAVIALKITSTNGMKAFIGCLAKDNDTWVHVNHGFTHPIHGFSEEQCNRTVPRDCGQFNLSLIITTDMERSALQCSVAEMSDPTSAISSSVLELTQILEAPENLTMSIKTSTNDTLPVMEGLEFVVKCQSTASTSSYDYAIYRGDSMISNQSTYRPNVTDRCGLRVTCQDNVAVKWTRGNTFTSKIVYPEFKPTSGEITVRINPPVVVEGQEFTFTCISAVDAITECSNFTYAIKRQKYGTLLSSNNTYTPGRDFLMVQCHLSTDANIISGAKLSTSVLIEPLATTRAVEMEWQTNQKQQLYVGEHLNITCKPVDITRCAAIVLQMKPTNSKDAVIGCEADEQGKWGYINKGFTHPVDGFSEEQCNKTVPRHCGQYNISVIITADLEMSALRCSIVEMADLSSIISSSAMELKQILEVPENLTMTIERRRNLEETIISKPNASSEDWPKQVVEGSEFLVKCQSTTSNASNFDYIILSGDSVVSNQSTYTPNVSDRCGLRVACQDNVAVHWTGGNILTTEYVYPEFTQGSAIIDVRIEPQVVVEGKEFTFYCSSTADTITECSNFTYEIRRQIDGTLLTNNNTYTPGRDALIIQCNLTTPANWISGVKAASLPVEPIAASRAVGMEWRTDQYPQLYVGQSLVIRCKPIDITRCAAIAVKLKKSNGQDTLIGCHTYGNDSWIFLNSSFTNEVDGFSEQMCNMRIPRDCGPFQLMVEITADLQMSAVQCAVMEMADPLSLISSPPIQLMNILDVPENLTMTIQTGRPNDTITAEPTPEQTAGSEAVEGSEFFVRCLSSASTSAYGYAIYSRGSMVSRQSTYTPNLRDRCGLLVTCQDKVAVKWAGGSTFTSTYIYPEFEPRSGEIAIRTEPSVTVEGQKFIFVCSSMVDAITECSNFTYEIRRQADGALLSITNTYTPGRDSVILRCNLSTDANWASDVKLTTSYLVEPIAISRAVEMEWQTSQMPQFYLGEYVNIRCKPVDITRCAAIGLKVKPVKGEGVLTGCRVNENGTWEYFNNGSTHQLDGFSEEQCNRTIPHDCGQFNLRVMITADLERSTLQCSVAEQADPTSIISSSALELTKILDVPENLTMTIQTGRLLEESVIEKPDDLPPPPIASNGTQVTELSVNGQKPQIAYNGTIPVTEGAKFFVKCQSTASSSAFDYAIYSSDSMVSNNPAYIPIVSDRCGLRVTCQDNVAVKWTGGNTFASKYIYPKFTPPSGEIAVRVEPSVVVEGQEFTYFCSSAVDAISECSNFTYEIQGQKDGALLAINNTYTPRRDALILRCNLSTLANWAGGVKLTTLYHVEPIASSRAIELEWQTKQMPQLYLGESLNITCNPKDITRCSVIALKLKRANGQEAFVGCYTKGNGTWLYFNRDFTHPIHGFSEELCNRTIPHDCGQYNLSVTITAELENSTLQCFLEEKADPGTMISSSALELAHMLEAPEKLTMSIKTVTNSTLPVMEGLEFAVKCHSTASTSSYEYAIYRGDFMISNQSTYMPNAKDRCGLRVTCQDNVAVKWTGGNTFASESIYPEFKPGSAEIAARIEPQVVVEGQEFTFTCISAVDAIAECSNFTYEIRRQVDRVLLSRNNTYTPTRDFLMVQCNLSTDASILSGAELSKSISIEPLAITRAVEMEWQTAQKQQLYIGELLNITCKPVDITRCALIALEMKPANGKNALIGCKTEEGGNWAYNNNGFVPKVDSFSEERCNRTIPRDCGQYNISLAITTDLEMSTLQCLIAEIAESSSLISSSAMELTHVLDVPKNLTMNIERGKLIEDPFTIKPNTSTEDSSTQVAEGSEFFVKCHSTASNASGYDYAIYRGNFTVSNQSTYTPNVGDRCGLRVTCQDNVAVHWTGGNILASKYIYPEFTPRSGNVGVRVEPPVVVEGQEFKFFCSLAVDTIMECSNFTYEIRRQLDGTLLTTNNSYTPGRDAITIHCILSTRANWVNGAKTTSLHVEPIAASRAVRMEWQTNQHPQLYVGQSLIIQCKSIDITRCAGIALKMNTINGEEGRVGCHVNENGTWGYLSSGFRHEVDGFSEEQCNRTILRDCGQFNLTVAITADLEMSTLQCAVMEMADPSSLISSSDVELSNILEVPENLTMTIQTGEASNGTNTTELTPEQTSSVEAVEGSKFLVRCQSTATTSSYNYAIYRGDAWLSNQSAFTPSIMDRCGLRVTCQDNVAVNWTGGHTFASNYIYPEFTPPSGDIAIRVEPSVVIEGQELTFFCSSTVDAISECSNMSYEIRRQTDGVLLSTNNTYTPGRDAVILVCNLSTEANWVDGVQLTTSYLVEPLASSRAVEMEWHTNQMPQFYLGESLNITCQPVDITRCAAIALTMNQTHGLEAFIGCRAMANGSWSYFNNGFTHTIHGFSDEQCRRTIPRDCGQFNLSLTITAGLEYSALQCAVMEMADPGSTISSSALKLKSMLEIPKNLTMTIKAERPLVEYKEYTVSIHTNMEGVPYFYKGQHLSVTCQPHNMKKCDALSVIAIPPGGMSKSSGCYTSVNYAAGKWAARGKAGSLFTYPTYSFCQVNKCSALNFNVTRPLASYHEGYIFYCWAKDRHYKGIIKSPRITINKVHDGPPPPVTSNETLPVMEGSKFNVKCRSSASTSSFDYAIYSGDSLISNQSSYTPSVNDRCGLRVTCQDNVATNWNGGDTFASEDIYPEFKPSSGEIAVRIEPSVIVEGQEFNFTCSSTVDGIAECSNYTYEIKRQTDGTLLSRTNTYIPGRDFLTLQCNLATAANKFSGVNLTASFPIEPLATSRAVAMEWQTKQKPQLYVGEYLNITCLPVDITRCASIAILMKTDNGKEQVIGCRTDQNGTWRYLNKGFTYQVDGISEEFCNGSIPRDCGQFHSRITISADLQMATFQCVVMERADPQTIISSAAFELTNILEVPENLTMTISVYGVPENAITIYTATNKIAIWNSTNALPVEEGIKFNITCNSTASTSAYDYAINGKDFMISNTSSYTPVVSDRCGIRVTCQDNVAVSWTGGNTVISQYIYPKFKPKLGTLNLRMEPTKAIEEQPFSFTCLSAVDGITGCSNYTYEIRRQKDGALLSTENTYIPTREPLILLCNLSTDANWLSGVNLAASLVVEPLAKSRAVQLEWQTRYEPDLYVGELLNITCKPIDITRCTDIGVLMLSDEGLRAFQGCRYNRPKDVWEYYNYSFIPGFGGINEELCNKTISRDCGTYGLSGFLTLAMEGVSFQCSANESADDNAMSSSPVILQRVIEMPDNLTMTIINTVTEGAMFTVTCGSTATTSSYDYKMYRSHTLISMIPTYQPVPDDRCGIWVTCQDNVAVNWTEENVFVSQFIYPEFRPQSGEMAVKIKPPVVVEGQEFTFTCLSAVSSIEECSNYSYEVRREKDGALLSTSNKYIPGTDSLVLHCDLSTDTNWVSKVTLSTTYPVEPIRKSRSVEVGWQTRYKPDIYADEPVNITCKPVDITRCDGFGIQMTTKRGQETLIGCRYKPQDRIWEYFSQNFTADVDGIYKDFCNKSHPLGCGTYTLHVHLSLALEGVSVQCIVKELAEDVWINSSAVSWPTILEIPENLTMAIETISKEKTNVGDTTDVKGGPQYTKTSTSILTVMEGAEFVVRCWSTASTSEYYYAIYRSDFMVANKSTYTPSIKDRCGLRVTCHDNVAVNWTGGNTFASKYIYPEIKPQPGEIAVRIEPKVVIEDEEFTFTCLSPDNVITECSNITYEILRQKDGALLSTNNTYTPGRDALTLQCSIFTDANWVSGTKTTASRVIEPLATTRAVDITWQTLHKAILYVGEPLTIICKPVDITRCAVITVKMSTGGNDSSLGCQYTQQDNAWKFFSSEFNSDASGINEQYCSKSVAQDCGDFSLTVPISFDMEDARFMCKVAEQADKQTDISSSEVVITEIIEPPTKLVMTIQTRWKMEEDSNLLSDSTANDTDEGAKDPKEYTDTLSVTEGTGFIVNCSSSVSTSSYDYAIYRNRQLISQNFTYTPVIDDRCGIRVTCQDNFHINWKDGNTSESQKIYPEFFTKNGNLTLTITPQDAKEGRQMIFNCSSAVEGIEDCSSYEYEVRRKADGKLLSSTNYYTPIKEDKDGLTLRCNMRSDANLDDSVELTAAADVHHTYVHIVGPSSYVVSMRPQLKHFLHCQVNTNGSPKYLWSRFNRTEIIQQTTSILALQPRSGTPGSTESITCVPYISGMDPVMITWVVSWSIETTPYLEIVSRDLYGSPIASSEAPASPTKTVIWKSPNAPTLLMTTTDVNARDFLSENFPELVEKQGQGSRHPPLLFTVLALPLFVLLSVA